MSLRYTPLLRGQLNAMPSLKLLQKGELNGQTTTLKSLSDTRWSCRSEALKSLLDNFEQVVVVAALAEISENDARLGGQANGIMASITNFHFLFLRLLTRRVLTQCNALSKALQASNFNYASFKDMACATMETIVSMKTEDFFLQLWNYGSDICTKNSYQGPQLPRQRYIVQSLVDIL
ncbi:UNVERIFIED_CONTAM: hypothetical protein FKN15_048667 [Acipenser sinensis]